MVWFTLPHQQGDGVVTDEQVKLLMSLLNQGIVQATAAPKAGMSERTARKCAFWRDTIGGEEAARVADPS
jgi:hypothetical protein